MRLDYYYYYFICHEKRNILIGLWFFFLSYIFYYGFDVLCIVWFNIFFLTSEFV